MEHYENAEHCVICGAIIPEGVQVCYDCLHGRIRNREKFRQVFHMDPIQVWEMTAEQFVHWLDGTFME